MADMMSCDALYIQGLKSYLCPHWGLVDRTLGRWGVGGRRLGPCVSEVHEVRPDSNTAQLMH